MRGMLFVFLVTNCTIEYRLDPADLAIHCREHVGEYPCPVPESETSVPTEPSSDSAPDETSDRSKDGYLFAAGEWDMMRADFMEHSSVFTMETWSPGCFLQSGDNGVPNFVVRGIVGVSGEPDRMVIAFGVEGKTIIAGTYGTASVFAVVIRGADAVMNTLAVPVEPSTNSVTIEPMGDLVTGTFNFRRICDADSAESDCRGTVAGQFSCHLRIIAENINDGSDATSP